jgi:hypothetical protein
MQQSVRELALSEQIRMPVDEAGKLYNGYFIFFTNSEEEWEKERWKGYAVPRIIAVNKDEFYKSGLHTKYKNNDEYGVPYYCWAYMSEEQIPPILTF